MVNYAVGGDSFVDRAASLAAGEVKMLICNKKHGCKRLMSVCRGKCAEERQVKHQIQVDRRKRAAEARDGAEARKQAKIEADRIFNDKIRMANSAAFGPRPPPRSDRLCTHLKKGRCNRGKACKHSHDHLPAHEISAITCALDRRWKSGACVAGTNCLYAHQRA